MVGTAKLYGQFFARKHMEDLGLMGVQVNALECFCALSWLWIYGNVFHPVYAKMAEFLAVVGIEIIIAVAP